MVHTFIHSRSFLENHTQFPVEDPGEGPAPHHPDFYAKKFFFFWRQIPLPLSKGLDDRAPPYLKDWIWHWFQTKMGKIYTRLRLKRRKNPTLWGGTYLYGLYKGVLPRGGCMGFPSIKSSYAYIWWLGLLRVVQALKVIILPLPLSAGVMCCPPLIFKPSLGRREKLPQKVGRREIYRPVPPPSLSRVAKGFSVTPNGSLIIGKMRDRAQISPWGEIAWFGICLFSWVV